MLEIAARSAQILIALGGAYLLALWFVLIVWTYRDIEARSNSVFTQIFSTLLVVLFFIPGILLYLLLRPKETLDDSFQKSLEEEYLLQDIEGLVTCPSCNRAVDADYMLCPHCQERLREPCIACGRLLDRKWPVCPYCSAAQKDRAEITGRVEPPAPRFIAPGLGRKRLEAAPATAPVAVAASATPARIPPRPVFNNGPVNPEIPASAQQTGSIAPPAEAPREGGLRPLDRFRPRPSKDANPSRSSSTVSSGLSSSDLLKSLEPSTTTYPITAGNPEDYSHPVFPVPPTSVTPDSGSPASGGNSATGGDSSKRSDGASAVDNGKTS